jgi:hypothetical protein
MPLQKRCNHCKQCKSAEDFYANKRMKDGLNTFCIACHKKDNIARKTRNRADTDFKKAEQAYKKQYREKTVAQRAAYLLEWRKNNHDHVKEYSKQYRESNKDYYAFASQKRKISLLNRTPAWIGDDDLWIIQEAYSLAALRTKMLGFTWHVDHVIPLRGKRVSGLHVPENLQVIPAMENLRKSNKYEGQTC